MGKGEFYKSEYILEKVPELKPYIPIKDNYMIGLSHSGNIKYTADGTNIGVISKNAIPDYIYRFVFETITGQAPSTAPESKLPKSQITPQLLNALCNGFAPINTNENFYAIKNSSGLFYRKKKNKKKFFEKKYTTGEKCADEAIAEIVLQANGDQETIKEKIRIIEAGKKEYENYQKELEQLVSSTSDGYAAVCIEYMGPCAYISIKAIKTKRKENTLPCRLDQPLNRETISQWVKNEVHQVILNRNSEEKEERKKESEKLFIKGLKSFIQKKGLFNISHEFAKEKKKNILKLYGYTSSGERVFAFIEYVFTPKKEWFVKKKGNNGIVHYTFSPTAKKEIQQEAKKIYDKFLNVEWIYEKNGSRPALIREKYKEYVNNFSSNVTILCCGSEQTKSLPKADIFYDVKKKLFYCDTPIVAIKEDKPRNLKITEKPLYKDRIKETSSSKYLKANSFIKEQIQRLQNEEQIEVSYLRGPGILYGGTELKITSEVSITYKWECDSYKNSLTDWKKKVLSNIREIISTIKKEQENVRYANAQKLGALAANYVACDVAKFITANEKYITQNATVHYLRGLKNTFGGQIIDTGCYGKYKRASSDYINDIIDTMIREGFLSEKELKGTYGRFNILRTNQKTLLFENMSYQRKTKKELKALLTQSKILNDDDAKTAFEFFRNKERKRVNDYMLVLGLIKSTGFICAEYETYVAEMQTAPAEVKTYLKMLKEMSEDPLEKKILSAILKNPVGNKK